jgi:16S rRNA (guanine966-N2)-methyltransferase
VAKQRRARPEGERGLRVIGGTLRGRKLKTPRSQILRPMRDQVREALFNILGPATLDDAAVLDLFSGSGSLGIEAISRGARRAVFVERAPLCADCLEGNLRALGIAEQGEVVRHDLGAGVARFVSRGPFDLVLIHPPFPLLRQAPPPGEPDMLELLAELTSTPGLLDPEATIAFETPRECYPSSEPLEAAGLEVELRREYGTTALFVTTLAPTRESG